MGMLDGIGKAFGDGLTSIETNVGNFFGGKSGLGKTGINSFEPKVRKLGDKEFRRELREQARGKNLGPNIAAREGRAAMDANLRGQKTALGAVGRQQDNAMADMSEQAGAARADTAAMNSRQMKQAIRAQSQAMSSARTAASSMAASGRGANVASARYMAGNQAAAAQTGIAGQTAEAQTQIAQGGQQAMTSLGRELSNAQKSAARTFSNERATLNSQAQDARITIGKNTAVAAGAENVGKTTAAKNMYLGTLQANQNAAIQRDQMKAGITNANAKNQADQVGGAIGGAGSMVGALAMMSDIKSKEDVKLSEPPKIVRLGDSGQYGPNYKDYKSSVEARGIETDGVETSGKGEKSDAQKQMAMNMMMQGFKQMSDIKSKENIAPARSVTQAAMSRASSMFGGGGGAANRGNQMQAAQQGQAQQGGLLNAARQTGIGSMLGGMGGGLARRSDAQASRTSGAANAARIAGGFGGMMSDRESKEDAKREAVREVFDELRPYKFRYKEDDAERMAEDFDDPEAAYNELREERYGVMAQDMEKTREGKKAVSTMHDRKAIDGPKALGLALAEIADLHERLEALESQRKGGK